MLFVLLLNVAHADIAADLRACFDESDVEKSKKCLIDLRVNDAINRPPPASAVKQAVVPVVYSDTLNEQGSEVRKVMKENLEPSYFTAGSGVHAGGDRTTTAMLYEAQVFQNLEWLEWSIARGPDKRIDVWLDLPIRIGVRQLSVESYPVRTPSFSPGLRLFVAPNDGNIAKNGAWYMSLGVHHYSNGQEGGVPGDASLANVRNGSFNTNYVEVALYGINKVPLVDWARLAYRQQLYGTWEPFQKTQYPKQHLSFEANKRVLNIEDWFTADLRWTETFGWGYQYVIRPGFKDERGEQPFFPGKKASVTDKLNSTLELSLKPASWTSLALYARYDHGYDYYNINFQNRMNRLQFGIVAR